MKNHSTGALSKERHDQQDSLYANENTYDFVIIGTGMAALTVGALLAHAGKKVCMLEAHDVPGGYAHTFRMGAYEFCAQIHYIWGCGKGQRIYEFLKHIGLEKKITFELLDQEMYDRMVMPDGKAVGIPYGFDKLEKQIDAAYPGQGFHVKEFCCVLEKIRKEMGTFPTKNLTFWDYITKWPNFLHLFKYRNKTLQNVFDDCALSKEAQAVLCANAGDFMLPPEKLSIFAYAGLFGGYNVGAYYPTKHFKHLTEGLATFIAKHKGCHIYYETEVTAIHAANDEQTGEKKISHIQTKDGKMFTAGQFICNMDPQTAATLIGKDWFPRSHQKQLAYEYSPSGVMVYLGLKDLDLKKYGFGKFNTWHMLQWDMNKIWKEQLEEHAFVKPWFFISTPSLHTQYPGTAPEGGHIMEIATVTGYDVFKNLQLKSYKDYIKAKMAVADRLIGLVEEHYIPDLRKHIAVKVVGTPVTHEDYCKAVRGNAYGSGMTPQQMGVGRLKAKTPFSNLFWCNASSGYAGVYGTVTAGMNLYTDLTGDIVFVKKNEPSDEELIQQVRKKQ
jgi:all-trans-retinol 13,14-reductase